MGITSRPKYPASGFERSTEGFRFGLDFDYAEIKDMRYRDAVASFWVDTIVSEALGDGFKIVDKEGIELPLSDEFQEYMETSNFLQEFIQLIAHTRCYGMAGCIVFESGELRAFEPEHLELEFDPKSRILSRVVATEKFGFSSIEDLPHEIELTGNKDIDAFFLVILDQRSKTFEGVSVLEKVWDLLNALWICDFMAAIYAARVGGGIKVVKGDMEKNEQDTVLASLREMTHTLKLVIPKDADFQLYTGDGQVNFDGIKGILYSSLSSATGIPMEKWRGVVGGQREGARLNRSFYYSVLKTIQDKSTAWLKRTIKLVSGLKGFGLPEKFSIEWEYKEELSEIDQANLEKIKADTASVKGNYMTGNEIREELELQPLEFFKGENEDLPMNMATKQNEIGINIDGFEQPDQPPPLEDEGKELTEEPENDQTIIEETEDE